ncbi:hypothetical protein LVY75_33120 (plasmid) [Sinorhizobium sp. B11]
MQRVTERRHKTVRHCDLRGLNIVLKAAEIRRQALQRGAKLRAKTPSQLVGELEKSGAISKDFTLLHHLVEFGS